MLSLEKSFSQLHLSEIKPTKTLHNVHQDDIHGITKVGDLFATISKDGNSHIFNLEGHQQDSLNKASDHLNYRKWGTAIEPLDESTLSIGTRNGIVLIWDINTKKKDYLPLKDVAETFCKERNQKRITCLKKDPFNQETLYIGQPTRLLIYNFKVKKTSILEIDQRDWLYCIEPYKANALLCAVGDKLSLWEKKTTTPFKKTMTLIDGKTSFQRNQRAFISSMAFLQNSNTNLHLSLFDGTIRWLDLTTQKTTRTAMAHKGRVWQVLPMSPHTSLSCGDDAMIKLWDERIKLPLKEIGPHIGRVSSLMATSDTSFIAASCPESLRSEEKAQLLFFDLR